MTEKRFRISQGYTDRFCHDWEKNKLLNFKQTIDCLNIFYEENKRLKYQNELLSDELEQCKAVVNKKWSEYLKKKELL